MVLPFDIAPPPLLVHRAARNIASVRRTTSAKLSAEYPINKCWAAAPPFFTRSSYKLTLYGNLSRRRLTVCCHPRLLDRTSTRTRSKRRERERRRGGARRPMELDIFTAANFSDGGDGRMKQQRRNAARYRKVLFVFRARITFRIHVA